MKTVSIKIECPIPLQALIEEFCVNEGLTFSEFFLNLAEEKFKTSDKIDNVGLGNFRGEECLNLEENLPKKNKGGKK